MCIKKYIIDYRLLTTETNSEALYIYFIIFNTTSSVKLFEVTVQIFVYKLLFTIVFFGKMKKNPHETFGLAELLLFGLAQMTELFSAELRTFAFTTYILHLQNGYIWYLNLYLIVKTE